MRLHPMHPAAWVLDQLAQQGWHIFDLLSFTRSSTLVLASRGHPEPVVVKAGFGSNHVLAAMPESERPAAYGFYWYNQLTAGGRTLAREDFRYERDIARSCAGATHVVPILDEGQCASFDWYTMPYYPCGNFRTSLPAMSIARSIPILADVADGLAELHARGIVHRDVYQENILLDADRGLITDLGAARHTQTARGPQHRGPEVHWPPEYAHNYAEANPAADVFSLAVLVYRVLYGDIPRLAGPPSATGIPSALSKHVTAALSHRPEDRPTMPQLRTVLRENADVTGPMCKPTRSPTDKEPDATDTTAMTTQPEQIPRERNSP